MDKLTLLQQLGHSLPIVIGIVLIWRGIWYVLDHLDLLLFGGNHLWTAIVGIALGLFIIYIPDKDFKEIQKI